MQIIYVHYLIKNNILIQWVNIPIPTLLIIINNNNKLIKTIIKQKQKSF